MGRIAEETGWGPGKGLAGESAGHVAISAYTPFPLPGGQRGRTHASSPHEQQQQNTSWVCSKGLTKAARYHLNTMVLHSLTVQPLALDARACVRLQAVKA